jgi:hypothetical protein
MQQPNLLKKLYYKIMNFDMEALISLKTNFQSSRLQWVKTTDPRKMGQIVDVVDIFPARNGQFIAKLSDNSQISTDRLTDDFYMITDGQEPLSIDQIRSINYIPSIKDDFKVSDDIPTEIASEIIKSVNSIPETRTETVQHTQRPIQQVKERVQSPITSGDLFGMFALEDTELSLAVKIKLPSKNLLKMMYSNSNDKKDFLTRLAAYINNNVTVESIMESMEKQLNGQQKKKQSNEFV